MQNILQYINKTGNWQAIHMKAQDTDEHYNYQNKGSLFAVSKECFENSKHDRLCLKTGT